MQISNPCDLKKRRRKVFHVYMPTIMCVYMCIGYECVNCNTEKFDQRKIKKAKKNKTLFCYRLKAISLTEKPEIKQQQ